MKKLIFTLLLILLSSKTYAPEFKGQTMAIPRIAQETPRATAYDTFVPTQQAATISDPVVVEPEISDLRIYKTIENDGPGYRSSIYDSPAMSR